jgi:hypothetical protein
MPGYPTPSYPSQPPGRPSGVTAPAVCLIVAGALSLVFYGIWMIGGFGVIQDDFGNAATGSDDKAADLFLYVYFLIGLVLAPFTLMGGVQMLRGRVRGFALIGAITAVVPVTVCCLGALPFGVWAIVILNRAEVRAWFRRPPASR